VPGGAERQRAARDQSRRGAQSGVVASGAPNWVRACPSPEVPEATASKAPRRPPGGKTPAGDWCLLFDTFQRRL